VEPQEQEPGIGELLHRLVEDGRGYARAEIGYYRTLARIRFAAARLGLALAAVALLLVLGAFIALVVGILLTLSPIVGPGFATLITFFGMLLIAGLLGWLGFGRVKAAMSSDA
jgi:hypothetical protein